MRQCRIKDYRAKEQSSFHQTITYVGGSMVRAVGISIIACGILMSAMAQDQIALSGTVTKGSGDGEGEPIEGAAISLKNQTATATTNAAGEFSLTGPVAVRNPAPFAISVNNGVRFGLKGNQMQFSIASGVTKGSLSIYSGNGRLNSVRQIGALSAGTHRQSLPDLAPGLYIVKLTLDNTTTSRKLVNTGSRMYLSERAANTARFAGTYGSSVAAIDTLVVSKLGYSTVKHPIRSYTGTEIAIEMDEDIVTCTPPDLPEPSGLTEANEKLPDPFKFFNGNRMTKKAEWPCRRKEILAMAQKYIYGPTPEVDPADVTGTISGGTVNASIEYNGATKTASFDIGSSGNILNISYGSGISPSSGCRTWSINNTSMDSYNNTINSIYGYKAGCRVMAAVWAVNVVCAVIDKNPDCGIDYVMTTGCSASGKSTFVTGCFCEGVDLTVIVESGGIGAANYRMAEWFKHGGGSSKWQCSDARPQNLDNTDTDNQFSGAPYFSTSVAGWVTGSISKIKYLPYDQHCLLACIAPRALCHFTNQNGSQEWCHLGGTCEALSAWAAEPVWNALGVPENMGFQMYPNNNGSCPSHCSNPQSATDLAKEFFKRVFEGDTNAETDVMVFGEGDGDLQQKQSEWEDTWVDWEMDVTLE